MLSVDGDNIVIVMHKKPDADALAAACILKKYFEKKEPDKKTYIVADYDFTVRFPKILDNFGEIIKGCETPNKSHLFIIDHNDREISILKDWNNQNVKNITIIDHHYVVVPDVAQKPLRIKPIQYIDTTKFSTCELLFDYLKTLEDFEITQEIATYIYVGIFSDSIKFQTPFKRDLLAKVWDLVDKYKVDIDGNAIYCYGPQIYYKRVTSYVWRFVRKDKGSKIASVFIGNKQYELLRKSHISVCQLCNEMLNTKDTYYAVLAFEYNPGWWGVRVGSKLDGAVKKIIASSQHNDVKCFINVEKGRVKALVASIIKTINEFDLEMNWEKEFSSKRSGIST